MLKFLKRATPRVLVFLGLLVVLAPTMVCSCGTIAWNATEMPQRTYDVPWKMWHEVWKLEDAIKSDELLLKTISDSALLQATQASLAKKRKEKIEKEADIQFYKEHGYERIHSR